MGTYIPQLVSMIESCPELKYVQPVSKPIKVSKSYRSVEEKKALQSGVSPADAQAMDHTASLQPGTIHISYHIIGLGVKDSCKYLMGSCFAFI
jgi:hypothetical protein